MVLGERKYGKHIVYFFLQISNRGWFRFCCLHFKIFQAVATYEGLVNLKISTLASLKIVTVTSRAGTCSGSAFCRELA